MCGTIPDHHAFGLRQSDDRRATGRGPGLPKTKKGRAYGGAA